MPYRRNTLLIVVSSLALSVVVGNPVTAFARNAVSNRAYLVELTAPPTRQAISDIESKPAQRRPVPRRPIMSIRGLRRRAVERPPRHRIVSR
jgi:hypothetical protein